MDKNKPSVVGPIWPPAISGLCVISHGYNMLHDTKDFTDVKLLILKQGDYPGKPNVIISLQSSRRQKRE
jgi:hypothetical protein